MFPTHDCHFAGEARSKAKMAIRKCCAVPVPPRPSDACKLTDASIALQEKVPALILGGR
jgi:hypothetical protein